MKEINELLEIAQRLRERYDRGFSIDGNIVGDIGEVLAEEKYDLTLHEPNYPIHDAKTSDSMQVQIKASFKNSCYISNKLENRPDNYLFINIEPDGEIDEIYNGPASFIFSEYKKYGKTKEQIECLSIDQTIINGNSSGYASISSNRLRLMNQDPRSFPKVILR